MAGTTASHNRAGQYLRNRRTPVTPTRTPRQSTIRGQFASASSSYQTLTTAQQNAWIAFAASYPYVDALGQTITLTGQQMYIAVSMNLLNAGQAVSTTPPTDLTVNPVTPVTIYADDTGAFIVTYAAAAGGDFVLGAYSALLSPGVQFNKTFTQGAVDATQLGMMDLSDAFAAQWGSMVTGRRVFARVQPVNASGLSSPGVIVQTAVVAASSLPTATLGVSAAGSSTVTWTGGALLDIITYEQAGGTGPFTPSDIQTAVSSPGTASTSGVSNKYKVRLASGGVFGAFSNTVAGS
jgi:hypothetical protein